MHTIDIVVQCQHQHQHQHVGVSSGRLGHDITSLVYKELPSGSNARIICDMGTYIRLREGCEVVVVGDIVWDWDLG